MKFLGMIIICIAILRDLPHDLKGRAAAWVAARLPRNWSSVTEIQDDLKKEQR